MRLIEDGSISLAGAWDRWGKGYACKRFCVAVAVYVLGDDGSSWYSVGRVVPPAGFVRLSSDRPDVGARHDDLDADLVEAGQPEDRSFIPGD